MVHDTYFSDRWATRYVVKARGDVVTNVDYTLTKNRFSGTALIVKDHKVLLHKGYGKQDATHANDVKTLYNIASIEKSMTSIMVVKLVQLGKLSFDTKLARFYPTIPNAKNITIRDMLTMTSGLEASSDPERALNEKQLTNYYVHHLAVDPRKGWDYDAVNFHLLVGVITQLTHLNYQDSFQQLIKLRRPIKIMSMPDFKNPHVAKSYHKNGRAYPNPAYIYRNEVGTGSFFMTAGDLYRYFAALVNGQIIPLKVVKQLFKTSTKASMLGEFIKIGYITADMGFYVDTSHRLFSIARRERRSFYWVTGVVEKPR